MKVVSEHPFGTLVTRHYQLENGLQVLFTRDPAAPVFAYQTWFAVGSRHEKEGTTGIAHLFEHLMFNQTETHAPGELDRLIEAAGGDTNAATWVDWTYYRDNLPSSELQLAVDLEADRMAHLTLGEKQVESEREVVMNERRFRVEDDVDGTLNEELYKLAFEKHPYHWPTIGWMRDIKNITIEDCRNFYRTYYSPNNATVVVVGDVDEKSTLDLIAAKYGAIPAQKVPAPRSIIEPAQEAERRAVFAKPVAADKLRLGYKSPPMGHADYPRLEVLSEILFGGNSARMHRRLVVDDERCVSVSAGLAPFREPGLYEIACSCKRGHNAAEVLAVLDEELTRVLVAPPTAEEVEIARTRLLTRLYRELRPPGGKAEALGHYHVTTGDYRYLFAIGDAYRAVTPADVHAAAQRLLVAAQRTIIIAEPDGSDVDDAEEGGEEE
jgi:zinc protease